jgi:diacylglycerol kinase family enzyme
MTTTTSALVVINPVAGANAQRVLERDRLRRALQRAGLDPTWHETTRERGADQIIAEHPGDEPVVVIGGDGTVHEATRRLVGGHRPLLVVPRGSGNIFAQRLSLSPRLERALETLRHGRVRRVDVGTLGGEPFVLGVGMGLDARVIREADRRLKQQVGKLAYLVSVARNLPVSHHDFELEVDGQTISERGASVLVANFGTVIGPFVYPERADGTDGLLDVAVMKARTLEQSISVLAAPLLPREQADKGVRVYRGTHVRVRCEHDLAVQIDGEDRGDHHEVVCGLRERSLPVVVPADH